jgi:hypothetical protein
VLLPLGAGLPPPRPPALRQPAAEPTRPDICHLSSDLAPARERAQKRYGQIPGVHIDVLTCPSAGDKPVVVLSKPEALHDGFRLHLHFHGDQFEDDKVDYDQKIGPTIGQAWEKDGNIVFVIPESNNENAAPRVDWSNIKDSAQLTQEAFQSDKKVGSKILSGHSAGGSPVAHAIAHGQAEDFSRIELYDAAVGSTMNTVTTEERSQVQAWTRQHEDRFLYVPGVITDSAWRQYIDADRWTPPAADHWTALWQSLGQYRQP